MRAGLEVRSLTVARGELVVCREVSLEVPLGEITVLLGANGAGKSTLLDGISGVLPAAAGGRVLLDGRAIERRPMYGRATKGLAYVEQGRSVFSQLTVAQNIAVVDRSAAALKRTFDLFPQLAHRRDVRAGLLSGGEQQMLVLARAIAMRPRVLLIDELSLGLAPQIVVMLVEKLVELADEGMGILLVEQFVDTALAIGKNGHVMQRGRIVRSDLCVNLQQDRDSLTSRYLASESDADNVQ